MLCVIDHETVCLYEKCRYWIGKLCVLTNIDRSAYPSLECRFKNEHVEVTKKK
jgi:hypothetical protein